MTSQPLHAYIYDYYRRVLSNNEPMSLGVELEFPIVKLGGAMIDMDVIVSLTRFVIEEMGFCEVTYDDAGKAAKMYEPQTHDCISFDICYATLEFSLGHAIEIGTLEQRFFAYFARIQDFLLAHAHVLIGFGTNPYPWAKDVPLVGLPYYKAQRDLITQRRRDSHSTPKNFLSLIASTHVHLAIAEPQVHTVLNLFNQSEWIKGALFANSCLVNGELDADLNLAVRDKIWQHSGLTSMDYDFPVSAHNFVDVQDYSRHLLDKLQGFYVIRDGRVIPTGVVNVRDYLEHVQRGQTLALPTTSARLTPNAGDVRFFRNFAYNVISPKYGTVEARSACAQPIHAAFAPVAFCLGIVANSEAVQDLLAAVQQDRQQLRIAATHYGFWDNKEIFAGMSLPTFLTTFCDLVRRGLERRGFGEERHLDCLYTRIETRSNPGRHVVDLLKSGMPIDTVVESICQVQRRRCANE